MLQWIRMLFLKRSSPYKELVCENVGSILLALSQFLRYFLPTRLEWINQTQKGYCAKSAYTKSIKRPRALIGPWWWRSHQRLQHSASWRNWLKSAACKTRVAIECSLSRIRLCPA